MSKLVMLLVCGVVSFIMFMACLINGVRWAIGVFAHRDCANTVRAFKKSGFALLGILLFMGIFVITTQLLASTPTIKDSNGKIVEGSIASLTSVKLNGHKEWITIRGYDKEAPVLLFLAGGPGGTQMAATRYELGELEKHFVVVSWDQPGSGKSYNCMNRSDITVETYIEDGIALTEYLLKTFEKKEIYLMGESWGSALGIFLINEKPEYYAGFIGTGQMVDFEETEKIDYQLAMNIAKECGDEKLVNSLIEQGEAPYYEGNIALQSATYLNYLSNHMARNP